MSQQPTQLSINKNERAIRKLRELRDQCASLKSELDSIKNITYGGKRKMNMSIKQLKSVLKLRQKINVDRSQPQNKENFNTLNCNDILSRIEVDLPTNKKRNMYTQQTEKLGEKILLGLQEIKLLEQRENLISKKNERLTNYYSQNKRRLDGRRSQVLENHA